MSSSAVEPEGPDLVCQMDNVQGMVDALTSVRWKRHQDSVVELSEHGIVLIVEESRCLQAKVYLQKELFTQYDYNAQGRPRFGLSLGLLVDCLNTFSVPGHPSTIEIQYPGPDMQLFLKSIDSSGACIYAEIRTRIPDTVSWDYNFEPAGSTPLSFTVKGAGRWVSFVNHDYCRKFRVFKCNDRNSLNPSYRFEAAFDLITSDSCEICYHSVHLFCNMDVGTLIEGESAALKEAIDDLEWPGSSVQIILQPTPPSVTFKGEGHGNLQIDFMYYANTDLLMAFHCDREVSYRYKYKFLRATTSNIPSSVLKENRGSKMTVGRGGMLKIQHLVSVARPLATHLDSAGYQLPSRIAYIEFFVKPEEED